MKHTKCNILLRQDRCHIPPQYDNVADTVLTHACMPIGYCGMIYFHLKDSIREQCYILNKTIYL